MKKAIGVIILAAGDSSRMGQCKFLLPMHNGLSFYENIVKIFWEYGLKNIVVITQKKHVKALEDLSIKSDVKPRIVVNEQPENERFYSLQLGINALEDVEYCFIHNADVPFLDMETLELMNLNKEKANLICPEYKGKGGHPILVNKNVLRQVLNSPIDSNLKDVLKSQKRWNVSIENELLTVDIDTPEDYKKYFD